MAWTSVHTVLGELENGYKVVMTDVVTDDAVTTDVTVTPLRKILFYFPGLRNCGNVAADFAVVTQSATILNKLTINPNEAASTGMKIGIVSIGV
jgi:hypothetical protein